MRFAMYLRYSHRDAKDSTTIEVQTRQCEAFIASQGGICVKTYQDLAKSGRSRKNRDGFNLMLADAQKGVFDAVVCSRIDRYGRDAADMLATIAHLRRDLGIPVFSATEFFGSADDPNTEFNELMTIGNAQRESKIISKKFRDARAVLFTQGHYLGSARPFGYAFHKTLNPQTGVQIGRRALVIHPEESRGVLLAFTAYSSGECSYADIARLLNGEGYQTTRNRDFSASTVETMLHNPMYIGLIRFHETQTTKGVHEAIITPELWSKVRDIGHYRLNKRGKSVAINAYLLRGLLVCQRCWRNENIKGSTKMSCHVNVKGEGGKYRTSRYRCLRKLNGYGCEQSSVSAKHIDGQVLQVLFNLQVPSNWKTNITSAMVSEALDDTLQNRLLQLRQAIENRQTLFTSGIWLGDKDAFIKEQSELKAELDKLTPPTPNVSALERAVDLLDNFKAYYDDLVGDVEAQNRLVSKIIERVFVYNRKVTAISFVGSVHHLLFYGNNSSVLFIATGEGMRIGLETKEDGWLFGDLPALTDGVENEDTNGLKSVYQ